MSYKILKDGEVVNTIVADEKFVAAYCTKHGYTFEPIPEPEPEPTPTAEDRISALEAENRLLQAQVEMQAQQQTFLEDCLLEMGDVVYA